MIVFFQIAGGVALIIFGVRFLRKGLDRLFGVRLVEWLSGMTQQRWKAFGSGIVVGTLAPSSTALSLISVQMLHAGQLTAERMLAVLLGANVGITVTVQLLAFHIQDYAGLFIVLGVLGFQFLNRENLRGVGQCLLALGFVFLAMELIGGGASALGAYPETRQWISLFGGHPLLVFFLVASLTLFVQSSTASIGFAIGLSASGLFGRDLLIPWVLGANVGIALTGLVAGWNSLEGKRLAFANLAAKLLIAVPLLFLAGQIGLLLVPAGASLAREIAIFHSGFNLLTGLVFVPMAAPIMRVIRLMIIPAPQASGLPGPESHLDLQALDSPALALANATRETLLMADGTQTMLRFFWKAYSERDLDLIQRVQAEDDRVDRHYHEIKDYLRRMGDGLTSEESGWMLALLTFSNELESVGDIIDKSLSDILRKQTQQAVWLPAEEYQVLCELYDSVVARFKAAVGILSHRGGSQAREFLEGKEGLNSWCRLAEREHYSRLRTSDPRTLAASAYFLDILDNFRRINSHISAIGYAVGSQTRRRRARGVTKGSGPDPM